MTLEPAPDVLVPFTPDATASPAPDPAAEPEGFLVAADDGTRIHFLDWGGPAGAVEGSGGGPGVVLVPGVLGSAWSWAPVARRLRAARRTVAMDLRGHGLSDAPPDGYDLATLAADAVLVAEGSGALAAGRVVVAGHGFGASVAAAAASLLGDRCAGLVLVDGGWERVEEVTGLEVEEFLRGLDEPPEVMRSMDAFLADRRAFDPATWDEDQERAALDAVVETAAGHLLRSVRPGVAEAVVRSMFEYEPAGALALVRAPVTALVALAAGDADARLAELRRAAAARSAAALPPVRVAGFAGVAHNLMRYRPAEVCSTILAAAAPA